LKALPAESIGLEKPDRIAISAREGGGRERAAEHRGGVEVQAVAAPIRHAARLRRVTVDDQTAVITQVGEEWLADPDQVVVALPIERLVRIDSGMDEKPLAVVVVERSERIHATCAAGKSLARATP